MNSDIIYFMEDLRANLDPKQRSKVIAYSKIIGIIKDLDYQITLDTKLSDIKGIGKGTETKIKNFLSTEVSSHDTFERSLTNIMGIGIKKAQELSKQVKSLEELRERKDELLNNKQKLGLRYYESDQTKIPRQEMLKHEAFIMASLRKFNPDIRGEIVGSFRRQKDSSGDIDLILTYNSNVLKDVIGMLRKQNYIQDTYANGQKKFMGWSQIENHPPRRLDILFTDIGEFPFSILYFTGSRNHNKMMRMEAIKKGYTLNEHGIFDRETKARVDMTVSDENDIFVFLELEYKHPYERI